MLVSRKTSTTIMLFLLAGLTACASTKVTNETPMVSSALPRPNRIWVYDFIADPAKIPSESELGSQLSRPNTPPTPEEIETGNRLGVLIAQKLAGDIQAMGLTATHAGPGSIPQVGDGVLRGYLVSVQEGNAGKRFIIGFGSGSSELDTIVEGYGVSRKGWIKLGSGELNASGNKMPGMVVPGALAIATANPIGLVVMGGAKIYSETSGKNTLDGRAKATADAIAEQLKIRFKNRGWIA